MLPRARIRPLIFKTRPRISTTSIRPTNHPRHPLLICRHAATATATVPAAEIESSHIPPSSSAPHIQRRPPTQPNTHKPPELRKTQLHRYYTALLRSSPLVLVFQHNNLRAMEFAGIRRELDSALRRVSAGAAVKNDALVGSPEGGVTDPAAETKLLVVQTGIFKAALRVVEHYQPVQPQDEAGAPPNYLTDEAWNATFTKKKTPGGSLRRVKKSTSIEPLLAGPVAVMAFPSMAPAHLAAALRILAPTAGSTSAFAAPKRKDAPGLYDGTVQSGLQKLLLLGAKVDGRVMDQEGVRWVGGLAQKGGLEGLRAEVVAILQSAGMGLVGALQGAGTSVWSTLESRRMDMDKGEGGEE